MRLVVLRRLAALAFVSLCLLDAAASGTQAQRAASARATTEPTTKPAPAEALDPRGDLGAEVFGGVLGVAAGATLGVVSGAIAHGASGGCSGESDFCGVEAFLIGSGVAILGTVVFVPTFVKLQGDQSGGDGSWLAAFGASLAGATAGIATVALAASAGDALILPGIGAAAVMYVGSAVIGYRSSSQPPVQPAIAPTADLKGLTLSLRGAF